MLIFHRHGLANICLISQVHLNELIFFSLVQNAQVQLDIWQLNTPVIVGLKEEYQLGDWIEVNCTVPALTIMQPERSGTKKMHYQPVRRSISLEWQVNGRRVS